MEWVGWNWKLEWFDVFRNGDSVGVELNLKDVFGLEILVSSLEIGRNDDGKKVILSNLKGGELAIWSDLPVDQEAGDTVRVAGLAFLVIDIADDIECRGIEPRGGAAEKPIATS